MSVWGVCDVCVVCVICMCMPVCMRRSEFDVNDLCQHSLLHFLRQGLLLSLELGNQLYCLVTGLRGWVLCLPSAGFKNRLPCPVL